MSEKPEVAAGKKRLEVHPPNYLYERIERDAKLQGKSVTDWCLESFLHTLECNKTRKQFIRDLGYHLILSNCRTKCSKCQKEIPEFTAIMYNRVGGDVICPQCYSDRFGDKARVNMILGKTEDKKDLEVLEAFIKEKAEEAASYRNEERLNELLKEAKSIQDFLQKLQNLELDCFSHYSEPIFKSLTEQFGRGVQEYLTQIQSIRESALAYRTIIQNQIQSERLKRKRRLKEIEEAVDERENS